MAITTITFEKLQCILRDSDTFEFNAQVITASDNEFFIYRKSDSELSDPDPIFQSKSLTDTYNFLNK